MANSDRKIIRGVRVSGQTYIPGQEDELDKLLSGGEVKRLSDKGYLQGKWSGIAPVNEAKPVEQAKPEPAKKEK